MTATVWILGDQLLAGHPALIAGGEREVGAVLLIESAAALARRPYGKAKLALLLSAMRHYADGLRQRGYEVDYRRAPTFGAGLRDHVARYRPASLLAMAAASHAGRAFQHDLSGRLDLPVTLLPNTQFLTGRFNPIPEPQPDRRYVMETFYRAMRRHFDVLMDAGQPAGGRWNYDAENRRPLSRNAILPPDAAYAPDALTLAVLAELETSPVATGEPPALSSWPRYAVTRGQALDALQHFLDERLPHFGPNQDAMTRRSHSVYHSLLSPYLNLGLLEPLEVIGAAEARYRDGRAPLPSVEGFVRQILGWREFMYWQYWRQGPGLTARNAWDATRPLPGFFWTDKTDMACLRHALGRALATGYNHHIERLMLLGNFLMLAGVQPAVANEWFRAVFIDAYDWVMPPNVLGMALNADDGLTATKPYIASANYINRMGDHCAACPFDPKTRTGASACPFNFLYWAFLIRHEARLRANPRFGPAVLGLARLSEAERAAILAQADQFLANEIGPIGAA